MKFFLVKKGGKYFKSESYLNTSGLCEKFAWVEDPLNATGATDDCTMKEVAKRYGGEVIENDF